MKSNNKIIRIILAVLFLILGLIGLVLPVIPQVPFLILSVIMIAGVSERLRDRIRRSSLYREYLPKYKDRSRILMYVWNSLESAGEDLTPVSKKAEDDAAETEDIAEGTGDKLSGKKNDE